MHINFIASTDLAELLLLLLTTTVSFMKLKHFLETCAPNAVDIHVQFSDLLVEFREDTFTDNQRDVHGFCCIYPQPSEDPDDQQILKDTDTHLCADSARTVTLSPLYHISYVN